MAYVQRALELMLVIVSDLLSFEMEEHQELMRKVIMYMFGLARGNNQYMTKDKINFCVMFFCVTSSWHVWHELSTIKDQWILITIKNSLSLLQTLSFVTRSLIILN